MEEGLVSAVRASLPYSRWLDYCSVSVFVSERQVHPTSYLPTFPASRPTYFHTPSYPAPSLRQARRNASGMLDALEALPTAIVQAKRHALRRIRHAFGFWANSTATAPSATDFMFAELCAHSRSFRAVGGKARALDFTTLPPHAVASGAGGLRGCLLRL